jgi:hypothetical protein
MLKICDPRTDAGCIDMSVLAGGARSNVRTRQPGLVPALAHVSSPGFSKPGMPSSAAESTGANNAFAKTAKLE